MNLYLTLAVSIVLFLAAAWLMSEWLMRLRAGRHDRDGGETG